MFDYNILNKDIYFKRSYAELYAKKGEKVLNFSFEKKGNILQTILLAKPITTIAGQVVKEGFYDASSPYGYSGILTNCQDSQFLEDGMNAFQSFCRENKIIAVFFRFHPFFDTECFKKHLNFYVEECPVVYIELDKNVENKMSSYSSTTRNIVRKCRKNLTVEEAQSVEEFLPLYYETMSKNKASDFYYFPESYFKKLITFPEVKLFHVMANEVVVSAGFFFYAGRFAHYHLSANSKEHRNLNGNYLLLDHAAEVGKELNSKVFLLGGGRTAALDDGLLKFKSKFSPERSTFNIGGLVTNDDVFKNYTSKWQELNPNRKVNYFLKYRLN